MAENIGKVISLSRALPIIFYRRGQLLNQVDYLHLVSSKDLSDLTKMLADKPYRDVLTGASIGATDLEKKIREYIVNASFRLVNSAPSEIRTFLKSYMSKPVYMYFALVLKAKIDGAIQSPTPRAIDAYVWNQLKVARLIEKIVQAKTVQELQDATRNFPDYRKAVEEAMSLYWKHGFLYMIDLSFAKSYFEKVHSTLKDVPLPDRDDVRDILGIEIDAYNIIAILRGKNWGFTEDILRELTVPHSSAISEKMLKRLIGLDTADYIHEVVELKYGNRFLKREGLSFSDVELEFRRIEVRECWKILMGDPFNYAQVFAIIHLIDVENQNLLAVIHGKDGKLSSERILQYVIAGNP
ncbi:MAG: V-type ATPase subunit [Candidatus Bathyarchaeota archaeon]